MFLEKLYNLKITTTPWDLIAITPLGDLIYMFLEKLYNNFLYSPFKMNWSDIKYVNCYINKPNRTIVLETIASS